MTAPADSRRALIASGAGRYADPWHPYERTSAALAEILGGAGFDVEIVSGVDDAMTALEGVDLLVVNAGDPWGAVPEGEPAAPHGAPPAAVDAFADALDRGIGVLALHAAVSSLRDYPEWGAAVGAIWLPGASFHPHASLTTITLTAALPGGPLDPFEVQDERYCALQPIGRSEVVAWHEGDGAPEPAAWVRTAGPARIAVDVLGHDERSYDAPGHRTLIERLALWAAGGTDR